MRCDVLNGQIDSHAIESNFVVHSVPQPDEANTRIENTLLVYHITSRWNCADEIFMAVMLSCNRMSFGRTFGLLTQILIWYEWCAMQQLVIMVFRHKKKFYKLQSTNKPNVYSLTTEWGDWFTVSLNSVWTQSNQRMIMCAYSCVDRCRGKCST